MNGALTPCSFFDQFNALRGTVGIGTYPSGINIPITADLPAIPPTIKYAGELGDAFIPGSLLTIPRVSGSGNESLLIPFSFSCSGHLEKLFPAFSKAYCELVKITADDYEYHTHHKLSDIDQKIKELHAEALINVESEKGADIRFKLGLLHLYLSGIDALKIAAEYFFQAAEIYDNRGLPFKTAMLAELGDVTNRHMVHEGWEVVEPVDNHQEPSEIWAEAIKEPEGHIENIIPIFLGLAHAFGLAEWSAAGYLLEASIKYNLANNYHVPALDDRIRLAWAVLGGYQVVDAKTDFVTQKDWGFAAKTFQNVADEWAKHNLNIDHIPTLRSLAQQAIVIGEKWKDPV